MLEGSLTCTLEGAEGCRGRVCAGDLYVCVETCVIYLEMLVLSCREGSCLVSGRGGFNCGIIDVFVCLYTG